AAALLVGGYDGSGNYGDIVLLDAALALLEPLDPSLLVLPVVERQFASTHEALAGEFVNRPRHVLYFDQDGGGGEDGLVPVPPPKGLNLGVSYLYGGGFLNPSWGERKLAMLRAVETLLREAGTVTRFSSGLQVDAEWIGDLDVADKALLHGFELLGARDDASVAALAQLGEGAKAINTGDDGVGILGELAATDAHVEEDGPLEVNVHFAEHDWVTGRPDAVRDFDVGLLAELSRLSGRKLRVRPLLAYLDPRVDERQGVRRFAAACEERGLEVGEPRVLRPANVAEVAAEMRGAALTVSCSFHIALTSLLLGLPTLLLNDTGYYDQKARGLLADFDLPDAFAPRSTEDPKAAAAAIAPHVLEGETGRATRQRIVAAGSRVRRRRMEAEADLLGSIGRGGLRAIGALAAPPPDEVAADDGAAEADAVAEAEARAEEAERRAADAHAQLGMVLGSTSWKATAPLRRLTRRLRGG
ncbi:MAG: polysaccharide pyruvyl transferase family protein, partial [Actinomycetota bacterium]|nr:polysaccharide pyruvyl transferase family protein [Actinomycetota bacterium]